MGKYTGKHSIGDTSALVLLWAGEESFQTEEARRYLQLLDLSAGIALYTST
ncbi:MAG: hypothetical protein NTV30_01750 [Chloroflexi bacterium]|nr:hypothetical protein [Chloroflexota bacterium]